MISIIRYHLITVRALLHLHEEREVAGAAAAREVEGRDRVAADQPVQQPLRPFGGRFDRLRARFDRRPKRPRSVLVLTSGSTRSALVLTGGQNGERAGVVNFMMAILRRPFGPARGRAS